MKLTELNLEEIKERAWALLAAAPDERQSPLRIATLASVDAAGHPQARSVVVRACDPELGTLDFYTDGRSPKVEELRAQPRAALSCYDPTQQLQLRLSGAIRVHVADEASAKAWLATGVYARRDYLAPEAPGTPLHDPKANDPLKSSSEPGLSEGYLALLRLRVDRLDWLVLDHAGHRRAELRREPAGGWSANWLVP